MKTKIYLYILPKLFLLVSSFLLIESKTDAQNTFPSTGAVGIGTTTPNASSLLEIKSTTKGLLIPRMTKVQRDAISTPATGLMIFQTNAIPGFYYYDGSAWKVVTTKAGWSLTGNAGTNPATNFIGTTDAQSLVFKVNNTWAGILDNSTYNTGTRNTAFGIRSLSSNTTGLENTAIGYGTLFSNQSGNDNSAFGKYALFTNSGGSYNTALGYNAMFFNTTGANNTAIGRTSLQNNVTGNENTANGGSALYANNTGTDNTAAGFAALNANYSGNNNTASGSYALYLNTTGGYNTATGGNALYSNLSGFNNVADGYGALYYATGNYNTGTGSYALYSTTGNNNAANGYEALFANTSGNNNTASGFEALWSNKTGYSNVAIGTGALFSNTYLSNLVAIGDSALYNTGTNGSATGNTAVGSKALLNNTSGFFNTGTGYQTLYGNNGAYNTANGYQTLYSNQYGFYNTAIGYRALYSNQGSASDESGYYNTAVGNAALVSNTTGSSNVAVGNGALLSNITGGGNVAMGENALVGNGSGLGNTAVGTDAAFSNSNSNFNYTIALGIGANPTASNQVRIGSIGNGVEDPTSIGGKVGWSTLSDGRVKKNIKQNVPGLAFINKLQPITYNLDNDAINKIMQHPVVKDQKGNVIQPSKENASTNKAQEQVVYTGFVAQDVEKTAKSLNYDFSGVDAAKNDKDLYGLRYADFVVPLVKAVQELSAINDTKDARIDTLQNQLSDLRNLVLSIQQKQENCSPCNAGPNQSNITQSYAVISDAASLEQNIPNPFSSSTKISYSLPQKYSSAYILITDKSGKTLKQLNVSGNGKGNVTVDGSVLSSGPYNYSLLVNGKLVATKQMILAR